MVNQQLLHRTGAVNVCGRLLSVVAAFTGRLKATLSYTDGTIKRRVQCSGGDPVKHVDPHLRFTKLSS